ncbi:MULTISPECIES: hypothetical protein [Streptomyces]|uniref:hypothetical protein n=1 Tax=Streptomyces TaxID=1883 RepID=UPI001E547587|nr:MULTISPECIES: hypothetical protein [Streptomyces]UFQ13758.1 hypothetical protein J2N69_01280 [Streptomyces huasconensis]WCL83353.1 hypothetical protein PPN52_01265 [Streptomyces sp. JCM 35825]
MRRSTGGALLAAAVAATGLLSTAAVPAHAGGATTACVMREGSAHTDWTGMTWDADILCDNAPGDVRLQSFKDSPVVGRMVTTRSWFVCWKVGDPHAGGNNIWYYTQADEVVSRPTAQGWGYMPAVMLETPQDPVPGLPKCSWG